MWGSVEDDYWQDIHKIMVCEPVLKMIRTQKAEETIFRELVFQEKEDW
jgi:hypothetical protein